MVSSKTKRQKALIFIIFPSQKSNISKPTYYYYYYYYYYYFVRVCTLQVLNLTMLIELGMGVKALELTPVSYL